MFYLQEWDGTFADLTRAFTEEFTEVELPKTLELLDRNKECRRAASRVFRLCLRDGRESLSSLGCDSCIPELWRTS